MLDAVADQCGTVLGGYAAGMPIAPYIAGPREYVGHDMLMLPGVNAVVLNDDGELLLGRRADAAFAARTGDRPPLGLEGAAGARMTATSSGARRAPSLSIIERAYEPGKARPHLHRRPIHR